MYTILLPENIISYVQADIPKNIGFMSLLDTKIYELLIKTKTLICIKYGRVTYTIKNVYIFNNSPVPDEVNKFVDLKTYDTDSNVFYIQIRDKVIASKLKILLP